MFPNSFLPPFCYAHNEMPPGTLKNLWLLCFEISITIPQTAIREMQLTNALFLWCGIIIPFLPLEVTNLIQPFHLSPITTCVTSNIISDPAETTWVFMLHCKNTTHKRPSLPISRLISHLQDQFYLMVPGKNT